MGLANGLIMKLVCLTAYRASHLRQQQFATQSIPDAGRTVRKILLYRSASQSSSKNRYMVMEVFLDPSKDFSLNEPVIITQFNLSKAIKDSILENFGECGLAFSSSSFQVKYVNPITKVCIFRTSREEYQNVWAAITMVRSIGKCPAVFNLLDLSGSIKACKTAALKYDMLKLEHYKLSAGGCLPADTQQRMQNCFEKIKSLEH